MVDRAAPLAEGDESEVVESAAADSLEAGPNVESQAAESVSANSGGGSQAIESPEANPDQAAVGRGAAGRGAAGHGLADESETAETRERPEAGEESEAADRPWYEQPGMPWGHQPTRADLGCWAGIMVVGVYGLLVVILRPRLITWSPAWAAVLTGGRSSVVAAGAFARVDGDPWWLIGLVWAVAGVSLVKFSWIYWWAGHLWGEGVIELWAGQTARAKRRAGRAVRLTRRLWWAMVILTFFPLPFPMPIVFAAVGAAGIGLRRFLVPVLASSWVLQAGYLALGWWIGQPVVRIVDLVARYLLWITLALLVGTLGAYWWRERRRGAGSSPGVVSGSSPGVVSGSSPEVVSGSSPE